mmetsp:Transcript_3903/g.5158  ORF Transcript_3903/g.5158 Transcript_3903/m.5158 type:complete len:350 (+) Transcript_3903:82-1131(+)
MFNDSPDPNIIDESKEANNQIIKRQKFDENKNKNEGKTIYGAPLRNLLGYGGKPVNAKWPNGAKVALQIVLNYEEGGENCLLHGDPASEHLLTEISGCLPQVGERSLNVESLYDYGARSGFWRMHRLLTQKQVPCTVYAVGMALERNPEAAKAMQGAGWEVASHGYRWIDYQNVNEDVEVEHIAQAIKIHQNILGERPMGLYQGKPNVNTRRLAVEAGFAYDSDSYADDLPYWNTEYGRPHLVIPYTLSENDMRFVASNGFCNGNEFRDYLIAHLNYLVEEGKQGHSSMMSVGLHCRLVGRPGRAAGLAEFLDHAKSLGSDVWICRRDEIAKHWYENHYPEGHGDPPSF